MTQIKYSADGAEKHQRTSSRKISGISGNKIQRTQIAGKCNLLQQPVQFYN